MPAFATEELLFPLRVRTGVHKRELALAAAAPLAGPAHPAQPALRRRVRLRPPPRSPDPRRRRTFQEVPRDQWVALIPDAHPGYITWDAFDTNQSLLAANAAAHGKGPSRRAPPGKDPPCCRAW